MLAGKRVLVIDDQPLIRKILTTMLGKLRCTDVFTAPNGLQAEQILHQASPDLIICDINMSPGDGLQFLKRYRDGVFGPYKAPVLFLTSNNGSEMIKKAIQMGVDGYLLKPINVTQLNIQISKVLGYTVT